MTELMPCPFCGAKDGDVYPIPAESTHSAPPVHYRQIYCFACDSRGPETLDDEKAGQAWNTRPAPSPTDAAMCMGCLVEAYDQRPHTCKPSPSPTREGWLTEEQVEAWRPTKLRSIWDAAGIERDRQLDALCNMALSALRPAAKGNMRDLLAAGDWMASRCTDPQAVEAWRQAVALSPAELGAVRDAAKLARDTAAVLHAAFMEGHQGDHTLREAGNRCIDIAEAVEALRPADGEGM